MSRLAKELVDRLGAMKAERSVLDDHWRQIAEVMSPFRDDFVNVRRTQGEKRSQKVYDGTAMQASENLASALWGTMTNSANAWFELRASDEDLNEDRAVKLWLGDATRRVRHAFSSGGMRFYTRVVDLFSDLVHFGTAVFYVDEVPAAGELFFSCRHLAECYIAENRLERVDTVFRRFEWTARQAQQQWGDRIGPKLAKAAEKEPERKFEFLHAVLPVKDYDGRPKGLLRDQQFAGVYIACEDQVILEERGYYEFPYQVPRWSQRTRSVYGDSPAMRALADARMAQVMARTTIVGAQKAVDPPLLATDEGARLGVRTTPGGIIYGGLDAQGRPLYQPLQTGSDPGLGLEMMQWVNSKVTEAFYGSLLMLVNQPGRTATEVLALQEEKMRLLGPHLGRVQSEFLDPLLERVVGIMARAGALPPPPPELVETGLRVEYVSPMARQQKASEAMALLRTFEAVAPYMQVDPEIADNFDGDEVTRVAADAFGLPPRVLRDPREVEARREQRRQAQLAAAMAEAAPGVAQAAKAGTEAAKMAQEAA
jgi:hypothetical protein